MWKSPQAAFIWWCDVTPLPLGWENSLLLAVNRVFNPFGRLHNTQITSIQPITETDYELLFWQHSIGQFSIYAFELSVTPFNCTHTHFQPQFPAEKTPFRCCCCCFRRSAIAVHVRIYRPIGAGHNWTTNNGTQQTCFVNFIVLIVSGCYYHWLMWMTRGACRSVRA